MGLIGYAAKRQIDGIRKAKERGVRFGAKKKSTTQQVEELCQRRKDFVPMGALLFVQHNKSHWECHG